MRDKIAAVYDYLRTEFRHSEIEDFQDPVRKAQTFKIKESQLSRTLFIKWDFLERNTANAIPDVLGSFLLAEHIREYALPIVVTPSGLSD